MPQVVTHVDMSHKVSFLGILNIITMETQIHLLKMDSVIVVIMENNLEILIYFQTNTNQIPHQTYLL